MVLLEPTSSPPKIQVLGEKSLEKAQGETFPCSCLRPSKQKCHKLCYQKWELKLKSELSEAKTSLEETQLCHPVRKLSFVTL
ncbi:hypothetical protein Nmel_018174 [Mimus melanotis]